MRILVCGLNFTPELTGIGKYTGEMAHWLAGRGHDVRVVTAPPYYPDWAIGAGYSGWRYRREEFDVGSGKMVVYRCPLWVPKRVSGLSRLLHLFSFSLTTHPVLLRQVFWRPDVVWVVAPALTSAPGAWLAARLCGARTWLHVQDFELDAALQLGILPGWVRRMAAGFERFLLRRFDRVSTISSAMQAHLVAKGVSSERAVLFPNWAEVDAVAPLPRPSVLREELGLTAQDGVALYAGNLGEKQGLDVLIEAARRLSGHPHLVFVIAGDGSARARLEAAGAGLPNIRWLPLQPKERLNELLNLADIHLLPQRAEASDLVMPSKLTGMLASGRPVVATATPESEVGQVVAQCGLIVRPGDGESLAVAIAELAADAERRRQLGIAARNHALQHLAMEQVMQRFEAELLALGPSTGEEPRRPRVR